MADHIRYTDISVERKHDGSLECTALHPDGYLVSQRYYGWTKRAAMRIFHGYANGIQS